MALGARLASVGIEVLVGSRSEAKANEACEGVRKRWPDLDLPLTPGTNVEAAGQEVVVVATPWDAAPTTAASVGEHLAGKVVVSMANALSRVDGEFHPVIPPLGSVAAGVQAAVPEALVAAAFHHLPAKSLADLTRPVESDVLICAESAAAFEATAGLVSAIPNLRPLHAGSLATAAAVEAFTAVLVGLNSRYKVRAAIRLTGIPDGAQPRG
jgi:NADPH-dependent F420 reductase